jgi:hypothetical protein
MVPLHRFLPGQIDAAPYFEAIDRIKLRLGTIRFLLFGSAKLADGASNDLQKAYLHGESRGRSCLDQALRLH